METELSYAGKRVIVTGAASGAGAATARRLVELGAEVHTIDIEKPDLRDIASFTECDVRDPEQVDEAAKRIGRVVNMLFHCAGGGARDVAEAVIPLMSVGGAIVLVSASSSDADTADEVASYTAARAETLEQDGIEIRLVRVDATVAASEDQVWSVLNAATRAD
jgi:NAD(P)-dependent dehydrogenase (short-subunit alcohol dehydrogenase family)